MLRVLEETPEGTTTTTWPVTNLADDTNCLWRVRATDGNTVSRWAWGSFFVNFQDETPLTPVIRNPGADAVVGTTTPVLRVYPGTNPEKDHWVYRYEVYEREDLGPRVALGEASEPSWPIFPAVDDRGTYWWRVQVEDTQGRISPWSEPVAFRVDVEGVNEPPLLLFEEPSTSIGTTDATFTIRWADWDTDDDARIALYHDTNRNGSDGELIVDDLSEGSEGAGDTYSWNISGLSEGTYYIYAVITDSDNTVTTYAPGAVTILPGTIDETPPTVQVSPSGGNFTTDQNVTIAADEPADIYYTLDGSEPTTNSTLYTGPIVISQNTTLKCLAVDPAGNTSDVVTEFYRFGPPELNVQVTTSKGRQLSGVRVYAFTESGAYTGLSGTTDSTGTATFNPDDFSSGNYKFRVDYLGNQFWSEVVPMPDTVQLDVVIEEEAAEVTVTSAGALAAGIRVYLFSASGAYLGIYQTTDANGQVSFDLPTGHTFSFRADILGSQYWSLANEIVCGGPNEIDVDVGGGRLQVRIQEDADTPMEAVNIYLFSATGSYLGQYQTSDEAGNVFFDVPAGEFTVRANYLGDQFWSEDTTVTTDTTIALSIAHQDVTVTVDSVFVDDIQPLADVKIYLYSEAGTYLGKYQTTDAAGTAAFHLPQKPYKVRADYFGKQYWSEVFTWTDPTVRLALADAEITVTGAGSPLANRNVYAFTLTGSYLGLTQATDAKGRVFFRLPEGSYKFRVDHQGSQYWSGEELLTAHAVNPVGISTTGGSFTVTAQKGPGEPLVGVNCYVFSDADVYLGLYGATDSSGQVFFDLADGFYKFRIDYLGYQFWSDVADVPNDLASDVTINHETVEVSVTSAGPPAVGTKVYLFSEGGAYLGQFKETDADGKVSYSLPADRTFQYRADIMGDHYWSDLFTVTTGGPNTVAIDAGGGSWQVTVQEQPGVPLAGINVYLFNQNGSYLGVSQTTGAAGLAAFNVPQGTYKVRADYLGYQFWSQDTLISENTESELDIAHQQTQVTVTGTFQGNPEPLVGVRVYLFTSTDAYPGYYETTDSEGKVMFNLPQKDYKVRVDYLAEQYWSDPFSWEDITVDITMTDAVVTITGGGFPQAGVNVYAFSATGTYLGLSEDTDSSGEVSFRLPVGSYKFRADYQGNQYWSAVEVIEAGNPNTIIISAGGGSFPFTVESAPGEALAGASCYVFNDRGTYLGMFGATDTEGKVFFDLADGDFRFRVDHLGYQFWSDVYTVPNVLTGSLNLGQQDVTITVEGLYQTAEPFEGVRVYLFTPSGSYLGQYLLTDAAGQTTFNLPDQLYKVRVDYLGNQFWSNDFQQQDTTVTIHQGKADIHVHRSGSDVEGAKVYLFSESGFYLGRYETTPADGRVEFILPDRVFKFRVDEGADQVWSQVVDIQTGIDTSVEIDLD